MAKIYLASSWRNPYQQEFVAVLREQGHEVYDFRNPRPGDTGFAWSDIEPDWQDWNAIRFRDGLRHPVAQAGFKSDADALRWCDTCVLLLPCGRSAHLELGWAAGNGKRTAVVLLGFNEPELMYLLCDRVFVDIAELTDWLAAPVVRFAVKAGMNQ